MKNKRNKRESYLNKRGINFLSASFVCLICGWAATFIGLELSIMIYTVMGCISIVIGTFLFLMGMLYGRQKEKEDEQDALFSRFF